MMTEKQKSLMKKLHAMVQQGTSKESKVAADKLNRLMKKYGIDSIDFDEDIKKEIIIRYRNKMERKILLQIAYKVLGSPEKLFECLYKYTCGEGKNTKYIFKCSETEALEIRVQFDFYKELFMDEIDTFLDAFVQKHSLFGSDQVSMNEMTEKQIEKLHRMKMMMKGMQDRSYAKRLQMSGGTKNG